MNRQQLVQYVIQPVLKHMRCYSQKAEDLLVMIAAHESRRCTYIHQVRGPAIGIYQMEPATHAELILYLCDRRPDLFKKLPRWGTSGDPEMMAGNLYYATFMARTFFLRFPEPIPKGQAKMAEYAKIRWNTFHGKAKASDYLEAFRRWK